MDFCGNILLIKYMITIGSVLSINESILFNILLVIGIAKIPLSDLAKGLSISGVFEIKSAIGAFGGQGLVFRWVPTSETAAVAPRASVVASGAGANYDHYIPSGNYRRFVVPKESAGKTAGNVGSINGLFNRVAVINAGPTAASVLYMEY
jgi:hypothetical protein